MSRALRVAHATDLHWFAPPALGDLSFKRVLGTLNLYARGRRHDYDPAVQDAVVAHLAGLDADAVFVTGDLTAQALTAEFAAARAALAPLLDTVPTLVIPGNHDAYADDAVREGRFRAAFGPWAGGDGPIARLEVGRLLLLGLDTNRPTWFTAAGRIPQAQSDALERALNDPAVADRVVVLGLHHPPVDRRGAPYVRAGHGLVDAEALHALLERCPKRPALILCGHVHHGFRSQLTFADGAATPVIDCGTSGHRSSPDGRRASCALYELDASGLVAVHRWQHDGVRFVPEPGGAFASGS